MDPWMLFAAAIVLIIAVCNAVDGVLQNKDKPMVHARLLAWWEKVYSTEVPNFPIHIAERTLRLEQKIFGKRFWSVRRLSLTVLLSIMLTATALLLGAFYEDNLPLVSALESILFTFIAFNLDTFLIYLINLIFDSLTIAITLYLLGLVAVSKPMRAAWLLALDGIAALLLTFGCGFAILQEPALIWDLDILEALAAQIIQTLLFVFGLSEGGGYTLGFYSATTLIPTLFYVTFLLVLFIAKPIASFGHKALGYTLEKTIEKDPNKTKEADGFKPFTLLGGLLSVPVAAVGLMTVILSEG